MQNTIFSDLPAQGLSLTYSVEEQAAEPMEWKRAYMEAPRAGELPPPDPGDTKAKARARKAAKKVGSIER